MSPRTSIISGDGTFAGRIFLISKSNAVIALVCNVSRIKLKLVQNWRSLQYVGYLQFDNSPWTALTIDDNRRRQGTMLSIEAFWLLVEKALQDSQVSFTFAFTTWETRTSRTRTSERTMLLVWNDIYLVLVKHYAMVLLQLYRLISHLSLSKRAGRCVCCCAGVLGYRVQGTDTFPPGSCPSLE